MEARRAHNPDVLGSKPSGATFLLNTMRKGVDNNAILIAKSSTFLQLNKCCILLVSTPLAKILIGFYVLFIVF